MKRAWERMDEGTVADGKRRVAINNSNKFIAFAFSGLDIAFLSLFGAAFFAFVSSNSLISFFFIALVNQCDVPIVFDNI